MTRPAIISVLGPSDVAALRELLGVFSLAFDDPDNYLSDQPSDDYLQRLLARDTFVAIVARVDGEIVGGIAAYLLPKFEQARSEMYLYDLAVAESHRRRGVATALIAALEQVAIDCGAHVVFVQADQGDAPAIALYDKLGRREEVLHFDILPRARQRLP